jgi:hypothetical protein
MTSADYVAIAISPALIMALVGSLVFFLIEVLYVGQHELRLNYVFALFVFATVLIARLAIEFGAEHASLFALPLGIVTFLVLLKFVEHPSPFSHIINLALMAIVWWWAHKLTVNCTLIDDDEDASGEGLMQRIGIDNEASPGEAASAAGQTENKIRLWRRLFQRKKQPHAPGIWVLYFSLIALPLFGLGQYWIPAAEVGRRRYVFALLAVYVAAALALLVTTSFLGLRRYLRQRRIEMPAPMAGNWVGVGVVVILLVMLLATLIPRPAAEYAISQVPWQVSSPDGLSSSRTSVGRDGTQDKEETGPATSEEGPQGNAVQEGAKGDPVQSDSEKSRGSKEGKQPNQAPENQATSDSAKGEENRSPDRTQGTGKSNANDSTKAADARNTKSSVAADGKDSQSAEQQSNDRPQQVSAPQHSPTERLEQLTLGVSNAFSSIGGILKMALYAILAVVVLLLVWRYRQDIVNAVADILRALRELLARLFGGRTLATFSASEEKTTAAHERQRSFAEFRDPFVAGNERRMPPEELVRYTFEAFEAWCRDGGCPRSPDQTPAELVRDAVPPKTELFDEARRMVRLYSEVAYAAGTVTRESADGLRELWRLMRAHARPLPEPATIA